jgi:two-component system, OmpR family, KDP operon response regulator KdpE
MATERSIILVLEEDPSLRQMIRTCLQGSGFRVEEVASSRDAIQFLEERPVNLALLDIDRISWLASIELCREVRRLNEQIGIVLIIAPESEQVFVRALEVRVDDYISKPLRPAELRSRSHLVLRRLRQNAPIEETLITAGELVLDLDRRQLRKCGTLVRLTPTEFNLLALLMKNRGVAMGHTQVLRTIWGPEYGEELEYLRSYIRSLRKKIEADPTQPQYLLTEPWMGYRFCVPSNSDSTQADVK